MRRLFEFLCPQGHLTEKLMEDKYRYIKCPDCLDIATRIVSSPQIKLEGITGQFPGAYEKWERVRAEKLAQERKRNASHGED